MMDISKSGALYQYLTFVSYRDRYGVHDTCSLLRKIAVVTLKILIAIAACAYVSFGAAYTLIVTIIGLIHGMDFQSSVQMSDPVFSFVGILVWGIVGATLVLLTVVIPICYVLVKILDSSASLTGFIRESSKKTEFGRVLQARFDKICVPVNFTD